MGVYTAKTKHVMMQRMMSLENCTSMRQAEHIIMMPM